MTRTMTDEERFQRLVYVADWSQDEVDRLLQTCAEKGLASPEQVLDYAQKVLDSQCLSKLRGGDASLDPVVAEAFRTAPTQPHQEDTENSESTPDPLGQASDEECLEPLGKPNTQNRGLGLS